MSLTGWFSSLWWLIKLAEEASVCPSKVAGELSVPPWTFVKVFYQGLPSSPLTIVIWLSLCLGWRRQWHPTPVLLPGESHGRRSLVGCSPWGRSESDTTERLHFDFSLSCIGEGNGNPLQCSCLENPRDGGAWWAAIYGVAQSLTRLKRLSSSSYLGCESFSVEPLFPHHLLE